VTFQSGEQDIFDDIEGLIATQYDDIWVRPWNHSVKIYMRAGNDQVIYAPWSVTVFGEDGLGDMIDYTLANDSAIVHLNDSYATIGNFKYDNIYTFEYITGTNHVDSLVGDDANINKIYALDGDDQVTPR